MQIVPSRQKKFIEAVAALAVIMMFYPMPPFFGMTAPAKNVLGLLLAGLLLWVLETVPLSVTALFLIIMQPVLGIRLLQAVFSAFICRKFISIDARRNDILIRRIMPYVVTLNQERSVLP